MFHLRNIQTHLLHLLRTGSRTKIKFANTRHTGYLRLGSFREETDFTLDEM